MDIDPPKDAAAPRKVGFESVEYISYLLARKSNYVVLLSFIWRMT